MVQLPAYRDSTYKKHVVAAVHDFVKAVSYGTKRWSASVQQDMLNLLTCLFRYGEFPEVAASVKEGPFLHYT